MVSRGIPGFRIAGRGRIRGPSYALLKAVGRIGGLGEGGKVQGKKSYGQRQNAGAKPAPERKRITNPANGACRTPVSVITPGKPAWYRTNPANFRFCIPGLTRIPVQFGWKQENKTEKRQKNRDSAMLFVRFRAKGPVRSVV
jgi:hypothetical protein